jgi:antirestriction protein ArdC
MSNKFNFEPTKNGTSATLEYYSTLLHELVHWTGSEKRLNRFEKNKKYFDNNAQLEYALEELIAEIGANILCCKFNIQKTINKNSLAYLKSWISRLKNDKLFILKSLTQSGQAVNFLKDNLKTNIKAVKTA